MPRLRPIALIAFALAACTNDPAPVAPVAAPAPTPVVSAAPVASAKPATECLPASVAKGGVVHVEAKDGKLLACFLDEHVAEGSSYASAGQSHPCALVDLDTGAMSAAPAYKVAEIVEPPKPEVSVETTTDSVKVCKGTQCKTVKVATKPAPKAAPKKATKPTKGKKPVAPIVDAEAPRGLSAFADDQMTKVFVFVPDRAKDGSFVLHGDIFDLASGKRTAHLPLNGVLDGIFVDSTNEWSGQWIGSRLVLRDQVCCGPGAAIVLFDPAKGKMKLLHGYSGTLAQDPTSKTWLSIDGNVLSAVDMDAITVTPLVTPPGVPLDPEATSATWLGVGGKIAFVHANPPGFAVVDPATKKAGPLRPLPLCAP